MTAQIYSFELEGLARIRDVLVLRLKEGRCPQELEAEFLDMIADCNACLDEYGYREYVS